MGNFSGGIKAHGFIPVFASVVTVNCSELLKADENLICDEIDRCLKIIFVSFSGRGEDAIFF